MTAPSPPSPEVRRSGPVGPPTPADTQQTSGTTADDLGALVLILGRLRRFLRQPATEADSAAAGRWLGRSPAALQQRPVRTTLWCLAEGDELEDGHTVLQIRRDARAGTVQVVTSQPLTTPELPGDSPVTVVRR